MKTFQKQFEEIKNQAILDPTPQNVYHYLYYQLSILNRSRKFADTVQEVIFNNPELDANTYIPVGSYALDAAYKDYYEKQSLIINKIFKTGGLIVFLDASEISNQQKQPIKIVKKKYNPTIKVVSNEKIEELEVVADNGYSNKFDITKYPSIIFIIPQDKSFYPLSEGYILTESKVYQRLIHVALKAKIIDKNEAPTLYKNNQPNIKEINELIKMKDYND